MEFSMTRYKLIGKMSEKIATKIRDLTIYPIHHIIDIPEDCAIRFAIKTWLNILQLKHIQLWNACSACDARLEKTDFCPLGCHNAHIVLRGKVFLILNYRK